jgi:TPR repeat protein
MAGNSSTRVSSLAHCKRSLLALCALLAFSSFLVGQGSKGFQMNSEEHNGEPSRRLALVIGNKDYPWKPLANPVNDATDVAAALEQAGFKGNVQRVFNAQHDAMKRAVRDFVASVHPGDFAFVYYSGHGVEVKGINYLLPVDLPANASEDEVEDDGVSAQRIASDLDDHGAAVKVIVLDACRDNPIKASRSAGGGLAPMEGLGSLIVFATEAGRTASDNSASRNGLFTQYLLKALTAKGVALDDAVRDVSRQMAADTNRQQVPAIYGLLERPVYLFTGPVTVTVAPAPMPPDPGLEAWNATSSSKDPEDFDDFIRQFPQSPYVPTARLAANRLRREAAAAHKANLTSPEALPTGPFTLIVSCDLACSWTVDGELKGTIQSGNGDLATVPPGDHVLAATSTDGRASTSQTVSGAAGTSKVVTFALQAIADSRSPALKTVADRGLASYNQKDYAHAQTDFENACSQRDMPSCRYLAYMYEFAVGVPQDYLKAISLLQNACDGGEMTSCHNLADMYQFGKGVSQDYPKAFSLFQRACTGGEFHGCDGLGFLYLNGLGTAKDPSKAIDLFKRSCDNGELQGCSNLASLYLSAVGVPQDDAKALTLFKTACDGTVPAGCDGLAYMYRFGRAVSVDLGKAHQLYEQACNAGFDESCKTLTSFTGTAGDTTLATNSPQFNPNSSSAALKTVADRGLNYYNRKDYAHALTDFEDACSQRDMPSCRYLAYMYEFEVGVPQDYSRALSLLKTACDGGEMGGCHNLADMYQFGRGVPLDYPKAFGLFQKACSGGEFNGCGGLAYMYLNGLGVTKDLSKASLLYKQACDAGELLSCSNLAANYLSAQGVQQDDGKAFTLFKSACDGKIPAGCDGLAYLYRFGRAVPVDLAMAHQLYEQACNAGFDSSCKTLKDFSGK